MKMSDFIRENRKAKGFTQEEFGKMFTPPINRAAISKWEKGHVTNIKRSQIQRMCEIFGCAPSDLMCFNELDSERLSKEAETFDRIKDVFGEQVVELVHLFTSFNEEGQEKLLDIADDMACSEKYKKDSQNEVVSEEAQSKLG